MNECINLMERFGDRYKITFDPAYDPRNRPRDKLDPWMMQIACQFGTVYPYGGEALAFEIDGHPAAVKALAALPGCRLSQAGSRERTFLFELVDFPAVARIVKPKRRRVLSDAQRAVLAKAGAASRFPSRGKAVKNGARIDAEARV